MVRGYRPEGRALLHCLKGPSPPEGAYWGPLSHEQQWTPPPDMRFAAEAVCFMLSFRV